jgi:branched-chain amino acid transport system permease protein
MKTSVLWRRFEWPTAVLMLLVVLVTPLAGSKLAVYNMTLIALFAAVVIGLNMLLGLAGQASFAQTTFMAIGGYGSALLTTRQGWDAWLALIGSAALAAVVAALVGRPLLRLRGHYLSMATFALSLGVYYFSTAAEWLTGGGSGIAAVPPLALGSWSISSPLSFYVLAWLCCGAMLLLFVALAHSHIGRAWRAISAGQDIAMALGIDVTNYKLLAFVLAAVAGSVAGSLYVEYTSFAGPDLYDINIIINLYFMLFIGGRGSIVGPVIGAAIVVLLPQAMSGLQDFQNLLFYIFLSVLLLVRPQGLFGGIPVRGMKRVRTASPDSSTREASQ